MKKNYFDFRKKQKELESPVGLFLQEHIKTVEGKAVKVSGNRIKGMPDYDVYVPEAPFTKVETKRPKGGVLSNIQKSRITWLKRCGIEVAVLKNFEEVKQFVEYKRKEQEFNRLTVNIKL